MFDTFGMSFAKEYAPLSFVVAVNTKESINLIFSIV